MTGALATEAPANGRKPSSLAQANALADKIYRLEHEGNITEAFGACRDALERIPRDAADADLLTIRVRIGETRERLRAALRQPAPAPEATAAPAPDPAPSTVEVGEYAADAAPDLKTCSRCHTIYPQTTEHYEPYRHYRDGLDCMCKECRAVVRQKAGQASAAARAAKREAQEREAAIVQALAIREPAAIIAAAANPPVESYSEETACEAGKPEPVVDAVSTTEPLPAPESEPAELQELETAFAALRESEKLRLQKAAEANEVFVPSPAPVENTELTDSDLAVRLIDELHAVAYHGSPEDRRDFRARADLLAELLFRAEPAQARVVERLLDLLERAHT